jgi:choline transport protein
MVDHEDPHNADDAALAMLGKKQVLIRRFSLFPLLCFAVCELITWETTLALFSQSFENGGPAGAVYGFIIAWCSTLSVYTVVSELASMAPIAGGQYYWVYVVHSPLPPLCEFQLTQNKGICSLRLSGRRYAAI